MKSLTDKRETRRRWKELFVLHWKCKRTKCSILKRIVLLLIILLICMKCSAQLVTSNPGEYAALIEGNEIINDQVSKQINGQTETAMYENTIAAEFTQIHSWQSKYNSYLKTVEGYASSLKAATSLYNDGAHILMTLYQIQKAVSDNKQGIIASISMNNLYVETATNLVAVFSLLKDAVAKGGSENMLTGEERSKTLWALNDKMAEFSKSLHRLYLSVRYYKMSDVWYNATQGMLDRDNGEVARAALSRWKRAVNVMD